MGLFGNKNKRAKHVDGEIFVGYTLEARFPKVDEETGEEVLGYKWTTVGVSDLAIIAADYTKNLGADNVRIIESTTQQFDATVGQWKDIGREDGLDVDVTALANLVKGPVPR